MATRTRLGVNAYTYVVFLVTFRFAFFYSQTFAYKTSWWLDVFITSWRLSSFLPPPSLPPSLHNRTEGKLPAHFNFNPDISSALSTSLLFDRTYIPIGLSEALLFDRTYVRIGLSDAGTPVLYLDQISCKDGLVLWSLRFPRSLKQIVVKSHGNNLPNSPTISRAHIFQLIWTRGYVVRFQAASREFSVSQIV
jgi:hypothetical protein